MLAANNGAPSVIAGMIGELMGMSGPSANAG
jgi:hypothetical protein